MKKLILAIVTLTIVGIASAQNPKTTINLVGGMQFTNFTFKNSVDQKDKTLKYQLYSSFGANVAIKLGRSILRPEVMFRQAGARTNFQGTQINWKMNYVNVDFAYLYSILDGRMFSIQPGIGIGLGYMMNGRQEIGDQRLNIIEEASMNRFEVTGMAMLNATAQITSNFSIGLEYRFGYGLNQIENDVNAQKTHNIYNAVLLNIGFTLGRNSNPSY